MFEELFGWLNVMKNNRTASVRSLGLGNGDMAKLTVAYDWSKTSLGTITEWPQCLKTAASMIMQSPVPIVILWGADGIMIYNDAYALFAGSKHPRLLGSKAVEGWPEVADFNRHVMDMGLKGKSVAYKDQALTLYRKNKAEQVWMDLSYSPIMDENGKPTGVMAIITETTERAKAERSMRQSDERFGLISKATNDVIWDWDLITDNIWWNESFKTSFGYKASEIEPAIESWYNRIHPDDREEVVKGIHQVIDNGGKQWSDEYRFRRSDGSYAIVLDRGYALHDEDNKPYRMLGSMLDITRRNEDKAALQQQLQVTETLTNNATACLFLIDQDGLVTFLNPSAQDVTGYSSKDAVGKPMHSLVHHSHPDGSPYPETECPLVATYRDGAPNPLHEDIFFRKDGTSFNALITGTPLPAIGGRHGTVVEFRDITAEKQAQLALQAERTRLYEFFSQAPAAIAVVEGPDHRYELANPFYQKVFNRLEKDLLGRTIREVYPEVAGQGIYEIFDTVYRTGEAFAIDEFPAAFDRSGEGKVEKGYFNFVAQPIKNTSGVVERILIHAIEVTEQVLTRQKIQDSEEQFKAFANNIQNLAWMADLDGWIYWYNRQWYDYTGTDLEEMQGWGWNKVHHPDHIDSVVKFVSKAWHKGETFELTFPLKGKDGQFRWFLTRAYAVKDDDGKVVRWIGTNTNIDEQKKAEAELKELNSTLEQKVCERTGELTAANKELARSNIELQDFAYVASHDLQEPLRKITAFAGLLESDYKDILPPDAVEYVRGLQRSSTRMRTLIDDLLTYSRVTTKAEPFKTVDLKIVVQDLLEDLQSRIDETKADIKIDRLSKVVGDPVQLRLLLQNLISNALKYKKEDVAPRIRIASKKVGDMCIISVQDNGIGFDESYNDRIFTIFQRLHGRTKYEGTGIGLAICKKIVERHNGNITAQSQEGEGSTFIVSLPFKQKG